MGRIYDNILETIGNTPVVRIGKLAPAGEGGIFLTDDDALMERATCLGDIHRIIELPTPARRFAATGFGIKTRMAPLSAAVARVQLRQLLERNRRRGDNLRYLSERLERLGFDTFQPPDHVQRVYFEYLIRHDPEQSGLPTETLVEALRAEGCDVSSPRYPLVHQQPIFTEGHFARVARLEGRRNIDLPTYRPDALPKTEAANRNLLKLPSFPSAERDLLNQYACAFEKVITHAPQITAAPRG